MKPTDLVWSRMTAFDRPKFLMKLVDFKKNNEINNN